MKYIIDRIEDNIVTLENIYTKKTINISIDNLPKNIKEGSILLKRKKYILLPNEKRKKDIRKKFNHLKKQ